MGQPIFYLPPAGHSEQEPQNPPHSSPLTHTTPPPEANRRKKIASPCTRPHTSGLPAAVGRPPATGPSQRCPQISSARSVCGPASSARPLPAATSALARSPPATTARPATSARRRLQVARHSLLPPQPHRVPLHPHPYPSVFLSSALPPQADLPPASLCTADPKKGAAISICTCMASPSALVFAVVVFGRSQEGLQSHLIC
jgi:hypothetical protein